MSKATEIIKKKKKIWGTAYYITEYLPVTAGIITAMAMNPHVWVWLIFIFLFILIVGGLIAAFRKSGKTIVWGLILVMVIAINGWVMYTVISVCFGFAFVNDIIVKPKYERYKASYEHYSQQDSYEAMNK